MTSDDGRSRHRVSAQFRSLAATKVLPGEVRLAKLDDRTSSGQIAVARGADDSWILLLPRCDEQPGRRQRLTNLKVGEETYSIEGQPTDVIELRCTNPTLLPQFTDLVVDVIDRIQVSPELPAGAVSAAITAWEELLRSQSQRLSASEEIGLFGELSLLSEIVGRDPQRRSASWHAYGELHDFAATATRIEVKTTATPDSTIIHVSVFKQLDDPPEGHLHLAHIRIAEDVGGETVSDLVARLRDIVTDPDHLDGVLKGQKWIGSPDERRFRVVDTVLYAVDDSFPRLTSASIDQEALGRVSDIVYNLDLDHAHSNRLDVSAHTHLLDAVATGEVP